MEDLKSTLASCFLTGVQVAGFFLLLSAVFIGGRSINGLIDRVLHYHILSDPQKPDQATEQYEAGMERTGWFLAFLLRFICCIIEFVKGAQSGLSQTFGLLLLKGAGESLLALGILNFSVMGLTRSLEGFEPGRILGAPKAN